MSRYIKIIFLVGLLVFVALPSPVEAADPANWRAGNIIDDSIFYNNNDMSVNDIQSFLNSKVSSCDTWGTKIYSGSQTRAQYGTSKGYPPPYTCLKDYSQNGQSAAQIIKDAANANNVSTRALIVLLQKEQSLVTDDWPWSIQYRSATGYGCPDTAPCDAQYYGFYNQVNKAAWQFRRYATVPNSYRYKPFQNNYIQYNPNVNCGGSNVYVENYATAGLYNYTPYQPNSSALNNLYGTGDGCGAYGNRNFWRLFNDWFRTTKAMFGSVASYNSSYSKSPCNITPYSQELVGRLYNPDTEDFLFTTSVAEACQAKSYGYIWDGIVMDNAPSTDQQASPVYRLANNERHIFTTSSSVKNDYIFNRGFHDEGIGYYVYNTASSDRIPIIGLQKGPVYFTTSSTKEAELYQSNYGYYSFGNVAYTKRIATETPSINRLSRNHSRLYTLNSEEKQSAIRYYGFTDEGTVSFNDSYPNEANAPVFRLRSSNGSYFYTMNRVERDLAVINYGYISEGIGFYSLLWSYKPVFRATNNYSGLRIFTNSYVEYMIANTKYGYTLEGVGWYGY